MEMHPDAMRDIDWAGAPSGAAIHRATDRQRDRSGGKRRSGNSHAVDLLRHWPRGLSVEKYRIPRWWKHLDGSATHGGDPTTVSAMVLW